MEEGSRCASEYATRLFLRVCDEIRIDPEAFDLRISTYSGCRLIAAITNQGVLSMLIGNGTPFGFEYREEHVPFVVQTDDLTTALVFEMARLIHLHSMAPFNEDSHYMGTSSVERALTVVKEIQGLSNLMDAQSGLSLASVRSIVGG